MESDSRPERRAALYLAQCTTFLISIWDAHNAAHKTPRPRRLPRMKALYFLFKAVAIAGRFTRVLDRYTFSAGRLKQPRSDG